MAKVTQIDYQNNLYDIEDADAQSKISDLQTAVANTYTRTQVDTKLDNYYDKTQTDNRFQVKCSYTAVAEAYIRKNGGNITPFTSNKDGMLFLSVLGTASTCHSEGWVTINSSPAAYFKLEGIQSYGITIPYKAGQSISELLTSEYNGSADVLVRLFSNT